MEAERWLGHGFPTHNHLGKRPAVAGRIRAACRVARQDEGRSLLRINQIFSEALLRVTPSRVHREDIYGGIRNCIRNHNSRRRGSERGTVATIFDVQVDAHKMNQQQERKRGARHEMKGHDAIQTIVDGMERRRDIYLNTTDSSRNLVIDVSDAAASQDRSMRRGRARIWGFLLL
jgi:hypothetical protein